MTNTPYSYMGSLQGLTAPFGPVYVDIVTNTGPSGGQYEAVGGFRVIIRNRSDAPVAIIPGSPTSSGVAFEPGVQMYGLVTPDAQTYNYYFIEPDGWTEFGIAPQAAEGLTSASAGLGYVVPVVVPQKMNGPQLVDVITIQTDAEPTLSY